MLIPSSSAEIDMFTTRARERAPMAEEDVAGTVLAAPARRGTPSGLVAALRTPNRDQ